MNEINLISKKREAILRSKGIVKIFRAAAMVSLFLVFISSVGIFLLKLNSPLPALKREETALLSSLSSLKQRMAKFIILNDRLKNISSILSKRSDFDKKLDALVKIDDLTGTLQNIRITSLDMGKKNISVTISSESLYSINVFIDNLVAMSSNKQVFKIITLENVTADQKSGRYFSSIDIQFL